MNIKNNKKKKMIKFLVIFILFVCFTFNLASAKFMDKNKDKNEGSFEIFNTEKILNAKDIRCLSDGIYLKDRRIFFPSFQKIYDPVKNTVTDSAPFLKNYDYYAGDGFVLEDGKVLFIGPSIYTPSSEFSSEIYSLLYDDLKKEKIKKFSKDSSISFEEYEKESHGRIRKYLDGLTREEREKLVEPKLKDYPDFERRYKEYKEKYEKSMYAQLYDPKTNTFSYTGKVNLRRRISQKVQLTNGNVLIFHKSSPIKIELYNKETGKFDIIKTNNEIEYPRIYSLKDDKILIRFCKKNRCDYYSFYDAKTNKFSESKNLNMRTLHSLQLKNGNILSFTAGCRKQDGHMIREFATNVAMFNPYTEEIRYVGSLAVNRGEAGDFGCIELQDGRILIYGGVEYPSRKKIKSAEIFDVKTGKSKIIGKMNFEPIIIGSILLDDGRVLIYGIEPEFYVPNK